MNWYEPPTPRRKKTLSGEALSYASRRKAPSLTHPGGEREKKRLVEHWHIGFLLLLLRQQSRIDPSKFRGLAPRGVPPFSSWTARRCRASTLLEKEQQQLVSRRRASEETCFFSSANANLSPSSTSSLSLSLTLTPFSTNKNKKPRSSAPKSRIQQPSQNRATRAN